MALLLFLYFLSSHLLPQPSHHFAQCPTSIIFRGASKPLPAMSGISLLQGRNTYFHQHNISAAFPSELTKLNFLSRQSLMWIYPREKYQLLIIECIKNQLCILKIGNHAASAVEISETRKEMFLRNVGERKRIWSMNFQHRIGGTSWKDEHLA